MKTTIYFPYFKEEDIEQPRVEQAREKPSTLPTKPTISTQAEPSSLASSESSIERVPCFRSL